MVELMTKYNFEYNHEEQEFAEIWRDTIDEYCEAFFEMSARFNIDMNPMPLEAVIMNMEIALNSVVDTPFPLSVNVARRSLIEAMNSILTGYRASLQGDDRMASNYLGVARRHMNQFELEAKHLGID